jgi:uncharacterized membrane protein
MKPETTMSSTRLEAFSDGVIAIIITIMVLELKAPHGDGITSLLNVWPVFLSYVLSYVMVAIYWVNHHRLFHFIKAVDIRILWANILLLFCLSFVPFATAYMGENDVSPFSTALYSATLLVCALAFFVLRAAIGSHLREIVEFRRIDRAARSKNLFATALYAAAIPGAYVHPAVALTLLAIIAAIYVVPEAWLCLKGNKESSFETASRKSLLRMRSFFRRF